MKIKLNLDALSVESFATGADSPRLQGTVRANAGTDPTLICPAPGPSSPSDCMTCADHQTCDSAGWCCITMDKQPTC